MKVMVLGATGFIGPALVRRLLAHGHQMFAVSRGVRDAAPDVAATILRVDRGDTAALVAALDDVQPDATIDLLAYSLEGTAELLRVLTGRTGRYVMASSGDVYRQYGFLHRHDAGPVAQLLAENAPLRTELYPYRMQPRRASADPAAWMDDYDKIPIEQALAASGGPPWSVVRLPMIYGPGDRQRRFAWAIGPMIAGAATLDVDERWGDWRSTYGFVDDVAEGLVLAATHPAAEGRTFNVGSLEARSNLAWAAQFAEAIGWRGEIRPTPRSRVAEPLRGRLEALDLRYPLVLDTRLARSELGYAEVTSPDEAARLTIADEAARPG